MREESTQMFPQPNGPRFIDAYIQSELKQATITITLQQIRIDGSHGTVTTDKKVPEDIMRRIRQFAARKGIDIKFLTSM